MRAPLPARAVVMRKGVSLMRPAWSRLLPAALLLLACCFAGPASVQDVTGALQGTVLSPEDTPEPDVHITVAGPHLQETHSTTTDRHGFFQFLVLPPGAYKLHAGRIGSRPMLVRDLVIELGGTTAVPTLTLTSRPIQMDSVIVVAPAASLDPVHTTMGRVIKAEDYAALPVDRDYRSIISTLPHANESYRGDRVSVAGVSGLESQYYIDGMNVSDIRSGFRATSFPYNFARSVNVRTGVYEAQHGRALAVQTLPAAKRPGVSTASAGGYRAAITPTRGVSNLTSGTSAPGQLSRGSVLMPLLAIPVESRHSFVQEAQCHLPRRCTLPWSHWFAGSHTS